LAATAPAVLAPILATDLGVTPKWIGVFIGLVYAGAMISSLVCGGFIARFGAIRVSQVCVVLCAAGTATVAVLPAAAVPLLVLAAIVIGLGYGPITPASSAVLVHTTPAAQMAMTFSIKQTGVPVGVALGGAILPLLALGMGWRGALLVVAAAGVLVALAAQPIRHALDAHRDAARPVTLRSVVDPLMLVLRTPALRQLSLIGMAFSAVQVSLTSYLVVFLHETLEWTLIASGLALTCATLGAAVGRIAWGVVADRLLSPVRTLTLIGISASLCGLLLAIAAPTWPVWLMLPLATLYGGMAIGWNGVQLAELARRAPPGTAGAVTGASGFVTFAGVVAGPTLFAALAGIFASYRMGFFLAAAISGIGAVGLMFGSRGGRASQ
ncbi:MAG: MFS transporter, partial [Betaproteobacteria bacterium]